MKLLLATDGSNFSSAATQAVVAQVKRKGTEIRVMHVVNTMTEPFPEMTAFDAEVMNAPNPQRKPAEALVQRTAKLLRAEGFNATTVVDWGDPRSKIIEVATKWRADLIVLGSHGRTGLRYLLMGSVSDGVAHHAPCSVQIVRAPKNQRTSKTLRVLLAIDDSQCSQAAANAVLGQVKPDGTEVRLLRILEPFPVAEAEKIGTREYPDFAGARAKLRDQAKTKLSKIVAKLQSIGFKSCQIVEEEGDPRDIILDYADRWGADLIVVGSHGRKGIKRFLMGSVSEAVSRYAGCSVEIVRLRSKQ
jgi:nucleotide-binding universal stress UspA family protein